MSDLCAGCAVPMPDRDENSPAVRRCQECWWDHQADEHAAGRKVSPIAEPFLASGAFTKMRERRAQL